MLISALIFKSVTLISTPLKIGLIFAREDVASLQYDIVNHIDDAADHNWQEK